MTSETPYRIALSVVVLLTIAITAYHRLQAASSKEKISHAEEGYLFAFALRLLALPLLIFTVAYLFAPALVPWAMLSLPPFIRWIGAGTGLLSCILMYWTLSSLGKNLTDTVVIRSNATLVTDGPYRWVRHPFYVAFALVLASVTLLTANWLIGISGVAVLSMLAIRTPLEERMLIQRFGQQYLDYMSRTGRFLPRWLRK
jgi:protein-S-isoprenylcysteine O-methyltransferase Ste14